MARQRLQQEEADLAVTRQRAADLTVRAQTDGTFVVPPGARPAGRYYHRGDLMATSSAPRSRWPPSSVPQDAIERVRTDTDRVPRAHRGSSPHHRPPATSSARCPGGDEYLPSKALAVDGGGDIATDPRDQKGAKAMQRMFQFDVALDLGRPLDHFGQRVYVPLRARR